MSLLVCAAPTDRSPPAAAAERIFGRTVADARKLLRRAQWVMICFPNDDDSTGMFSISKRAFGEGIRVESDSEIMPCELRHNGVLLIGGSAAIAAAKKAPDASRA